MTAAVSVAPVLHNAPAAIVRKFHFSGRLFFWTGSRHDWKTAMTQFALLYPERFNIGCEPHTQKFGYAPHAAPVPAAFWVFLHLAMTLRSAR